MVTGGREVPHSSQDPVRDSMIGFLIRRVLQALMVVIAMSIIVFLGVYAIGNPIDVMIDPDRTKRCAKR